MSQITIYLDMETEALMDAAVKAAGASRSKWIADTIRERMRTEWPASIYALAGAWPDLPLAEELRKAGGADTKRERL